MHKLADERWSRLSGGYKTPFDPRRALVKLQHKEHSETAWFELWEELHHQGDVGDASYASVPQIVAIARQASEPDWNAYALTAIIELARTENKNPHVPDWLSEEYFLSIHDLAEIGATKIARTEDPDTIRAILSVIAIAKGLRAHAKLLLNYSEDELLKRER